MSIQPQSILYILTSTLSPGNPFGRPQGIGWINELIARLTVSPVNDTTQTNHTLDSNPSTFPLENMTMWADFTHDNEMNAVLAAMGVLRMAAAETTFEEGDEIIMHAPDSVQQPLSSDQLDEDWVVVPSQQRLKPPRKVFKEMDPTNPDPDRKWVASRLVPFTARFIVEKLSCPSSNHTTVEAVRFLLNDAVLHIPGCREDLGNGVCTLEEFLETQVYARSGGMGEWEKCQKVA